MNWKSGILYEYYDEVFNIKDVLMFIDNYSVLSDVVVVVAVVIVVVQRSLMNHE